MADLRVVGKSVTRLDALEKVTGRAKYCSDFHMPGMLYATTVKSPYAHARILRIDTTAAENLPGVRAVVTPADAPEVRGGLTLNDEFILPRDGLVRCVGQAVAVVAADTREIAEDAADLVEVDYEELPAVFDPEAALREKPPAIVHPEMGRGEFSSPRVPFRYDPAIPNCFLHYRVRKGDMGRGFQEADLVVENRYSTSRIAHCALETHRVDAWIDNGTITLRMSSQSPTPVQNNLAVLFGVPTARVRVLTSYLGGGFGGKFGDDTLQAPLAVLAAMKSGRPVRLENSRAEEFTIGRHRADVVTYIKDGVRKDGTLVAREMKVILNIGRHAGVGYILSRNILFGAVGTYRIPNFRWDGYGVYTNNPVTGAFRGFGTPEINWAIEQQMDIMAEKLGVSPVEVRRKNLLREGDRDVCGQATVATGAAACLDRAARWIEAGKKPESQGAWRTGRGIAIGNKYTTTLPSCATVKVHRDGTVEVRHGNVEIGQGLNTVVAQIAAEEFGVPVDRVKVVCGDTAVCPPDYGAVSSRSTYYTGNAVRLACRDAKRRVFELAAAKLGVSVDSLDIRDGRIFSPGAPDKAADLDGLFAYLEMPFRGGEIIGSDCFFFQGAPVDPETGQSEKVVTCYSHFAQAVEVAVNVETGEVKVLRIFGAADGGTIVNPEMAQAQMEGGVHQGISSSIFERVVLENGVVTNPNFAEYKMMTARELPPNRDVECVLQSVPHPEGPFGAKGLGEGVMVAIAPAIGNAVYNAVGIRLKDLPISREKVWNALREKGR